jgi:hypothetical protein
MVDDRENFTSAVRVIIAGRAGYRCTFPSCGRLTIGPGAAADQVASIGVACHIFSASPNGPRGQGGLTADQLKDSENGFWACGDHSKLVDTNEGARYPAATLLGWRALHEARIHREMGGIRLPVNWVDGIEIIRSPDVRNRPMFKPGERLSLSRVTLLIGNNGSGKTALCDWIGATDEEGTLSRWVGADLSFALTVYNPEAHRFVVASLGANFSFQLDGVVVPFNPLPVVVLVLRRSPPRGEEESDLGWVARWLGVTPEVVRRLVEGIASEGNPFVEAMTVSSDGKIEVDLKVHRGMLRLGHRGGSGDVMVALALAVARAQHTSLHAPTLLLIDEVLSAFDPFNKSVVLEELGRADRFQSLATLPEMDRQLRWSGWSVVHIESREGGALITAS